MLFKSVHKLTEYSQYFQVDKPLERSFFEGVASLYQKSGNDDRCEIVSQLSKTINIPFETAKNLIMAVSIPEEKEDALATLLQNDNNCRQQLQKLQERLVLNEPLLVANFGLQRQRWVLMLQLKETHNIQHITRPFVFSIPTVPRATSSCTVDPEAIRLRQAKRKCVAEQSSRPFAGNVRAKKRTRFNDEFDPNLLMSDAFNSPRSKQIAEKRGIKRARIQAASPSEKYGIYTTPSKKRKFRSVLSVGSQHCLFKVVTPNEKQARRQHPQNKLENTDQPLQEVHMFTAKPECLTQSRPRRSQKAIKGGTAVNSFKENGFYIVDRNGYSYHWSHIIGLCLGGSHDSKNIAATTNVANSNIYKLVEKPIRDLFKEKKTDAVEIKIIIEFEADCSVPKWIKYELKWDSPQQHGPPKTNIDSIDINPRTWERASRPMVEATQDYYTWTDTSKPLEQEFSKIPPSPVKC